MTLNLNCFALIGIKKSHRTTGCLGILRKYIWVCCSCAFLQCLTAACSTWRCRQAVASENKSSFFWWCKRLGVINVLPVPKTAWQWMRTGLVVADFKIFHLLHSGFNIAAPSRAARQQQRHWEMIYLIMFYVFSLFFCFCYRSLLYSGPLVNQSTFSSHISSASSDAQLGSSRTAGSASCVRENPRLLCPV